MRIALLLLALAASAPALAADGRIEISHTGALAGAITPTDAANYPVTLAVAGSYVLTSDLAPPAGTSAIVVTTSSVEIDLNGFALRGGFSCAPGSCPLTTGRGVEVSSSTLSNVAVSGGSVIGFGRDCVFLGSLARAERLRVAHCGINGISAGAGSRVIANQIDSVSQHGIALSSRDAYYGDNLVGATALGIAGGRSIVGGAALSGNVCADGGCSQRGAPRYFLTTGSFPGNTALAACGTGFHMASLYELLDPSGREYDASRGATTADSGKGPPANSAGWIRMGAASSGTLNCGNWTSNLISNTGMRATLLNAGGLVAAGTNISPWQVGSTGTCDTPARVWCAED